MRKNGEFIGFSCTFSSCPPSPAPNPARMRSLSLVLPVAGGVVAILVPQSLADPVLQQRLVVIGIFVIYWNGCYWNICDLLEWLLLEYLSLEPSLMRFFMFNTFKMRVSSTEMSILSN